MKHLGIFILGALLLASCATNKRAAYIQQVQTDIPTAIEQDYQIRIKPLDRLTVTINSKDPELAAPFNAASSYNSLNGLSSYSSSSNGNLQILTVDKEGKIQLPIIGEIDCDGLTRYELAKKIIRFINDLGAMIDADPDVRGRLKIVYLEEYNVTMSERLMPASEVSEQISLAGTEASGTGNMKLMQNGAITLGTMDGANVEIAEQVGPENIIIFGMSTPEVEEVKSRGYRPADAIARSPELQRLLEFMERRESPESFWMLANHLRTVDQYMAAADFESYSAADDRAAEIYYNDPLRWQRMSLANIAGAGIFCADRAIHDYARDIWHLD